MRTRKLLRAGKAASWRSAFVTSAVLTLTLTLSSIVPAEEEQPNPPRFSETEPTSAQSRLPETRIGLDTDFSLAPSTSPIRWGHLSVLSFGTMFLGDSNFASSDPSRPAVSAGGLQGLFLYSLSNRRTDLDIQYHPYALAATAGNGTSFIGNSIDMRTYHKFSRRWAIRLANSFIDAPETELLNGASFTADFSTGQFFELPFLAAGQKYLSNRVSLSSIYRVNEKNRVTFSADYQFVRLSTDPAYDPSIAAQAAEAPPGRSRLDPPSVPQFSFAEVSHTVGGKVSWVHAWKSQSQVGLAYDYLRGTYGSVFPTTQHHGLMFTYAQNLGRSVQIDLRIGPSISLMSAGPAQASVAGLRTQTVMGSFHLIKRFRTSGLALSLERDPSFAGVVSNAYNNRAYLSFSRELGRRVSVVLGGGYIQQGLEQGRTFDRATGWGGLSFAWSQSWESYVSYAYFGSSGGTRLFGPQRVLIGGVRWSWRPKRTRSLK